MFRLILIFTLLYLPNYAKETQTNAEKLIQYNKSIKSLEREFLEEIKKQYKIKDIYELIDKKKFYKAIKVIQKINHLKYFEKKAQSVILMYLYYKNGYRRKLKEELTSYNHNYYESNDYYTQFAQLINFHMSLSKKKDVKYGLSNTYECLSIGRSFIEEFPLQDKFVTTVKLGIELLEEFVISSKLYTAHMFIKKKNISSAILYYRDIIDHINDNELNFNETSIKAVENLYSIFKNLELDTKELDNILFKHRQKTKT